MTVSIERLLLRLWLDQDKDETSMKAFCFRDEDHVCEKMIRREQSNEA